MSRDSIIDSSSVGGASGRWFNIGSEASNSSSSSNSRGSGIFAGNPPAVSINKDIWLGQKYMDSTIAEQVHSKANALDSDISLEVSCFRCGVVVN
jgi:hypothetical protein